VVGLSFSNAFVCIFLVFGLSTAEQRSAGKYFIFGRFLGLIILGLIIASFGIVFDGYIFYFMVIFGVLTTIFGALVIIRVYYRAKDQKVNLPCATCDHPHSNKQSSSCPNNGSCYDHGNCYDTSSWFNKRTCLSRFFGNSSKITKRFGLLLGIFRGATPCLKIFILAPLLIIVELQLAFLMILVFAIASTIYPFIGFLSANLLSHLRKYDAYVQVTGAVLLISIGIFTIFKQIMAQNCLMGI
jgi:cytochrome c biogenesis protein CcdA